MRTKKKKRHGILIFLSLKGSNRKKGHFHKHLLTTRQSFSITIWTLFCISHFYWVIYWVRLKVLYIKIKVIQHLKKMLLKISILNIFYADLKGTHINVISYKCVINGPYISSSVYLEYLKKVFLPILVGLIVYWAPSV